MTGAYGFPYVVSALSDQLVSQLTPAGITLAGGGAILFGRDKLAELLSPPRIVVVPRGGPFIGRDAAHPSNVRAAMQARPIDARRATGEAHCWGCDYDQAELLMDQMRVALQKVAAGQVQMGAGTWLEDTNVVQAGQCIIFEFSVVIPVVDGPITFAPTGTKPVHTGSVVLPDGTEISNVC